MPRTSERSELLSLLKDTTELFGLHLAANIIQDGLGDAAMEDAGAADGGEGMVNVRRGFHWFGLAMIEELERMRRRVEATRYVAERRGWRMLKSVRQPAFEWYFAMNIKWFRSQFRVDHKGFNMILKRIRDDPVFRNNSRNRQAPVEYQLMVALSRLGHNGNGISVNSVAQNFRIAEGTAVLWTRRVIVALVMIQDQWVIWPDQAERLRVKTSIGQASAFGQCLGYVHGSLLPMELKPAYIGHSDWYSRKARYSVNSLFVSDDQNRIIYMSLGWGGAAHDQRVFRNTSLKLRSEEYFEGEEYLLADSAYKASRTVVPAYKENDPNARSPVELRRRFNKELSRMRVGIEHTIGMLKMRFASLRGLRHLVSNKVTFKHLLLHTRACVVLHNMLIGQRNDTYWQDFDLPSLRQEWEEEARELREIVNRENPEGDYTFFTDNEGEDMREALRFKFQLNNYDEAYSS